MKNQNEMTEETKKAIAEIKEVIASEKHLNVRAQRIYDLGYSVIEVPMGAGGVGQVREMNDCYRVQISHGKGKYNYAYAAIISK